MVNEQATQANHNTSRTPNDVIEECQESVNAFLEKANKYPDVFELGKTTEGKHVMYFNLDPLELQLAKEGQG